MYNEFVNKSNSYVPSIDLKLNPVSANLNHQVDGLSLGLVVSISGVLVIMVGTQPSSDSRMMKQQFQPVSIFASFPQQWKTRHISS